MDGFLDLSLAEAIAIRESLFWLKALCMDNVVVESDYLMVIEMLTISPNIDTMFVLLLCIMGLKDLDKVYG
ncbi:hypothetical protein Goari_012239, partial [Gossypium aridum]|nr:hypothetical protein [Gossypium aridum]